MFRVSNEMILLTLPDIIGMMILMGVLAWARTKYRDQSVDLWLLGMAFVLGESVAVAIYKNTHLLHASMHVIALDMYLLAAVTFGAASRQDLLPGRLRVPFFLLPALPMFLIATMYGFEVTSPGFYRIAVAVSLVLGCLYILWAVPGRTKYKTGLLAIHVAMWLPMFLMAMQGGLRWIVYWGLGCLYLLVAASFRNRVRRDGIGGLVIVSGFVFWAMCLLLHPMVRNLPIYEDVLGQIWNMQKFFVIIGMLLVLLEDQTRRREDEAMHDSLTGLPNRRLFDDRLAQALERSRRLGTNTVLFALDLDGFKQINDLHGHRGGDRVLQLAATRLREKIRSSDTLARCGGDEFCVIVSDVVRVEDCKTIAENLRSAVAAVAVDSGGRYQLSCSVGYAQFPQDASDAASLYERADSEMYRDKAVSHSLVEV
jgi:diguanylate cyclase (GGDEF)-like protein